VNALSLAKEGLSDEHRLSIRNRLWGAFLGRADKTTDISHIPIDKHLFREATKEILVQVYPEESLSFRGRP